MADVAQLKINCGQAADEGLRRFAEAANQLVEAFARAAEAFGQLSAFSTFPDEANERARCLLVAHLSPEQRRMFEAKRHFIVQGKLHRWRITQGPYNVHRLGRSGRCRGIYCAVPRGHMPEYDVMLAQKLVLETDETVFLNVANQIRNYRALDH